MQYNGWIKKFPNVNMNIINLKKIDKPMGRGQTKWIMFLDDFKHLKKLLGILLHIY